MRKPNKILYLTLLINGVFFLAVGILLSTKTIVLPRGDISPIVFYVVGGVLVSFGLYAVISDFVEKRRLAQCKASGRRINAVIVRLDCNRSVRILGRLPATLLCKDESGAIYRAKFLYDYGMAFRQGEHIAVYVDIENAKKYAIDLQEYLARTSEG